VRLDARFHLLDIRSLKDTYADRILLKPTATAKPGKANPNPVLEFVPVGEGWAFSGLYAGGSRDGFEVTPIQASAGVAKVRLSAPVQ
jgi:hypothetical protein